MFTLHIPFSPILCPGRVTSVGCFISGFWLGSSNADLLKSKVRVFIPRLLCCRITRGWLHPSIKCKSTQTSPLDSVPWGLGLVTAHYLLGLGNPSITVVSLCPAHTFINSLFVKPSLNYPDMNMPHASCWDLGFTLYLCPFYMKRVLLRVTIVCVKTEIQMRVHCFNVALWQKP